MIGGDKVVFLGMSQAQIDFNKSDDPHESLIISEEYEVRSVDIRNGTICVVGTDGRFNIVGFAVNETSDETLTEACDRLGKAFKAFGRAWRKALLK